MKKNHYLSQYTYMFNGDTDYLDTRANKTVMSSGLPPFGIT